MTMVYLQASGGAGPVAVSLELDAHVELAMAKLEQPGNPAKPVPPTTKTKSKATWSMSAVGQQEVIVFSIDWLGIAPQAAGQAFDATLTVADAQGALLQPYAGSDNPTIEGGQIGPAENPTFAGTLGVAIG